MKKKHILPATVALTLITLVLFGLSGKPPKLPLLPMIPDRRIRCRPTFPPTNPCERSSTMRIQRRDHPPMQRRRGWSMFPGEMPDAILW
jgi:hypothetical protein